VKTIARATGAKGATGRKGATRARAMPGPQGERLRVERHGDVTLWTITRPEVRNAFDFLTFDAIFAAIDEARRDPHLRAVVLTGAGSTFVSGGDLRELRAATTRADAGRIADHGRRMCHGIARLPVPVIAALPGPAVGGGAELAVACDLRVADPSALLSFKHARMALTTAWGILPKLVSMVGHGTAARLLLAGHDLDATAALRVGLVDAVCDHGTAVATAMTWAREVAKGAPRAIASLKALLRDTVEATPVRQRAHERSLFLAEWTGADHHEAVEAFFDGRPPRWGQGSSP
jgi:enoyl-CoA hydratase